MRKHLLVFESGRNTRVPQDLEVMRRKESADVKSKYFRALLASRVHLVLSDTRISPSLLSLVDIRDYLKPTSVRPPREDLKCLLKGWNVERCSGRSRIQDLPQLSGRSRTHDLPRYSPMLNQLSHRCAGDT